MKRKVWREKAAPGYWRVWIDNHVIADDIGALRAWCLVTVLAVFLP